MKLFEAKRTRRFKEDDDSGNLKQLQTTVEKAISATNYKNKFGFLDVEARKGFGDIMIIIELAKGNKSEWAHGYIVNDPRHIKFVLYEKGDKWEMHCNPTFEYKRDGIKTPIKKTGKLEDCLKILAKWINTVDI